MAATDNFAHYIEAARAFAEQHLSRALPHTLYYHNLHHTREVVGHVRELGQAVFLNEQEQAIAEIAAWFHDTGFAFRYDGHEEASAELAGLVLEENNCPAAMILRVKEAIRATRLDADAVDLLQSVMRDADLLHLGKPDYREKMEALRRELNETQSSMQWDEVAWLRNSIQFYQSHQFETEYAREKYEPSKQNYLEALIQEAAAMGVQPETAKASDATSTKSEKKKSKKAAKELDRGVQTMFRNTLRSHIELSAIADNKANIMLSVNAIILSIVVANLAPLLERKVYLIPPTLMLILVSILALITAILAVRPSVTSGRFHPEDIRQRSANLLFFGNFYKMPLEEFEWGLREMMQDQDFLYTAMIRDFYALGQVLAKKYRYLRICYNIFMIGLVAAALAFSLALLFFRPEW